MDYGKRKSRSVHYIIFVLFCIAIALFAYHSKKERELALNSETITLPAEVPTAELPIPPKQPIPTSPPLPISPPQPTAQTQILTINPGETLAELLHRAHQPSTLWFTLLKSEKAAAYLEHLQAGHTFTLNTLNNQFSSLSYEIDASQTLIERLQKNNQLFIMIDKKPITKMVAFKSSIIGHSLSQAEKATGLPTNLQHQLDQMIASSDFAHSIHRGDRLNVLYREYFVGDQKVKTGDIVAAEINHGKKDYRVVRFTAPNNKTGIYMANGEDTKPAFLSAPVAYKRIGSSFQHSRFDPVIHKIHPHLAVDLDAPQGTPVKAIGNGVVLFCSQVRGYGNVVMIRYNNTYKTLYAHLEGFAGHLHANQVVSKGQVVGYVGSTGWSTGPHLHYAVYKNGIPVNPLTTAFPRGNTVPNQYRHYFTAETGQWFKQMKKFESSLPKQPELVEQTATVPHTQPTKKMAHHHPRPISKHPHLAHHAKHKKHYA